MARPPYITSPMRYLSEPHGILASPASCVLLRYVLSQVELTVEGQLLLLSVQSHHQLRDSQDGRAVRDSAGHQLGHILEQSTPLSPSKLCVHPQSGSRPCWRTVQASRGQGLRRKSVQVPGYGTRSRECESMTNLCVYILATVYHRLHYNYWRLLLLVVTG